MSKKRDTNKQKMIFIVSIFLVVIIVAWIVSLGWTLFNTGESEDEGSVKNMVGGIERSIASFSTSVSDKKINFNSVIESLRQKFAEEQAEVDSITDSMMAKLSEAKIDTWSEYVDELIYFKYPIEWPLKVDENVITLESDGDDIMVITVYKEVNELPDNINNLLLIEWLDEQVDRELGIFSGYELTDLNVDHNMYVVSRKDDLQGVDVYWQKGAAAYHLKYNFDEQIDRMIKLIISTIK